MKTAITIFDEYIQYLKNEIHSMTQTINATMIKKETLIENRDMAEKARLIMRQCERVIAPSDKE